VPAGPRRLRALHAEPSSNPGATPLSLYVFSSRAATVERCLTELRSGGAVVNDCLVGETQTAMPFGGVGSSGNGSYHGRFSFEAFTQPRSVIFKHLNLDNPLGDPPLRYPPFPDGGLKGRLFRFAVYRLPNINICPSPPRGMLVFVFILGLFFCNLYLYLQQSV